MRLFYHSQSEVENLNRQLNVVTQENNKLREELKQKEQTVATTRETPSLFSNNIEALSSLTKKLQEISTTYDDVRRDMTKLQQVIYAMVCASVEHDCH